jgi:hypothetical protein
MATVVDYSTCDIDPDTYAALFGAGMTVYADGTLDSPFNGTTIQPSSGLNGKYFPYHAAVNRVQDMIMPEDMTSCMFFAVGLPKATPKDGEPDVYEPILVYNCEIAINLEAIPVVRGYSTVDAGVYAIKHAPSTGSSARAVAAEIPATGTTHNLASTLNAIADGVGTAVSVGKAVISAANAATTAAQWATAVRSASGIGKGAIEMGEVLSDIAGGFEVVAA